MKGRANYLCLHRLEQLVDGQSLSMGTESIFLPMIQEWSAKTETGDRAELEDLPEDLAFWNSVSATAETCLGTECTRYDECFITRMRQRAAESDVVVVNHHLLCADASVRQNAYGEVIPSCAHAIIDEAHQLEDVATQYFGVQRQHVPSRRARAGYRACRLNVPERFPGCVRAKCLEPSSELPRSGTRALPISPNVLIVKSAEERPIRGRKRVRVTDGIAG
mgnify:CR=1 FL=1